MIALNLKIKQVRQNLQSRKIGLFLNIASQMPSQKQYSLELQENGNLTIPASVRQDLSLQFGDRLILTVEADGSLRLVKLKTQVEKLQGIFKDIAPGVSLADELIRERRQEAR